jgi:16S rRNA processing protein RimM
MSGICVGRLGKTVGLKGEIRFHIDSDFPDQFKPGLALGTDKNRSLEIEYYLNDKSIIKFIDINSLEDARVFTNSYLYISYEDSKKNCELKKGEYFWFDIIGCSILEEDTLLGSVIEVQRINSTDYLIIETSKDLIEQKLPKTFMIPYIKAKFILDVDIENKTIKTKECKDILEAS